MVKLLQHNANHCRVAMDLMAQFELKKGIGISIISEPHGVVCSETWFVDLRGTVAIHWNPQGYDQVGIMHKQGQYSVMAKWRTFNVNSMLRVS